MRNLTSSILVLSVSAALLSACGGGDEGIIVDERDPEPSGRSATLTVTAAGDAALNGIYTSSNVNLNNVTKVNPIGSDPETCRFKFSGPQNATTSRIMGGDVRYIPGTETLQTTFVAINGVEFRLIGTTGARVDRAGNEIDYTGAVLTSTQGTGQTITLSGSIPMLENRPGGC
jgi:hypothetical protein